MQFQFDYDSNFPVAMVMLEEDSNLKDMRFNIVPKEYVVLLSALKNFLLFTKSDIFLYSQKFRF